MEQSKTFKGSSVLDEVSYDEGTMKLTVAFKSGSMYEYNTVPKSAWDGLLSAASAGQYFIKVIRPLPNRKI